MGGAFNDEGMGGFFHPGCPMVGYVERDVPNSGSWPD
jgi:hypothetical protein